MRDFRFALCATVFAVSTSIAQTQTTNSSATPSTDIQYFGSIRLRLENYNWFPTTKGNGEYDFVGGMLRFGASRSTAREDILVELAAPVLWNLPSHAIATAPQGQLGGGGTYYASQGRSNAGFFAKQAYVRFKNSDQTGPNIRLGRFEFADGAEVKVKDATLNYLLQNRIAQRLIGNFGFSVVGRSFDGGELTQVNSNSTFTGLLAFPTQGVFTTQGMKTLTDVHLGYASVSFPNASKTTNGLGRLFAVYYGDSRQGVTKTDNRSAAVRATDKDAISIGTFGGNYLSVMSIGNGTLDTVFWAAGQVGKWGLQSHSAYSYDGEVGYQLKKAPMQPWLRAGYYVASGDGNSANSTHGTFFPILLTPRVYARYPIYTEANIKDLFVQLILKPGKKWTLRGDIHNLQLANSHDLWYGGGGAYDNSNFGYSGRPSGGRSDLGMLYDLSIDFQLSKATSIVLYGADVRGGSVVKNIYQNPHSTFTYLELNHKF